MTKLCPICGALYVYRLTKRSPIEPRHCGALRCRALHDWTDDDWAGAARMARARARVGIELSTLDEHAHERSER